MKFHTVNLYIKSTLRIIYHCLCPLDVLNVLYHHQSVPCVVVTKCHIARLKVVCACACACAFSCACVTVCEYVCSVHVCMCMHVCMRACRGCVHVCVHVHMCMCAHVYMLACLHVHVRKCMCVCGVCGSPVLVVATALTVEISIK